MLLLQKRKIYFLIITGCLVGYTWLYFNNSSIAPHQESSICIMKQMTGISCPSCGSTRSILSILHGNFAEAAQWNPLGFLMLMLMIILPVWIIYDLIWGKDSFFVFYVKAEACFKQKRIAIPFVTFILLNWCWNIYKNL